MTGLSRAFGACPINNALRLITASTPTIARLSTRASF